MMTKYLLLSISLFFVKSMIGQDLPFEKIYLSPSISIGYTIGATFNVGVDFDATTSLTSREERFKRGGLSLSHYWIFGSDLNPHRMTTLNIMYENEFMDAKTGYGLMQYRWGRSNVNSWGLSSWAFDVSFTKRDGGMPWLGIKSLVYSRSEWTWFNIPYVSLYAKQKFYLND